MRIDLRIKLHVINRAVARIHEVSYKLKCVFSFYKQSSSQREYK